MDYLQQAIDAGPEDVIEVTLDHRANVQLMDALNFENYRNGRPFRYRGGHATRSPVRLTPPDRGRWHIVIDLGGGPGTVRASVRVDSWVRSGDL